MYQIYKNGELKKTLKTRQQVADHVVCTPQEVSVVIATNRGRINGYRIKILKSGICVTCGDETKKGDDYCTPCYEIDLLGRSVESYQELGVKTNDDLIYPSKGF